MVNLILLKSTLIFGTIQLISMIALDSRNIALNTSIAFGIITSFINHATTSDIAKWSDRTMMLVGIYIDVHVIESMHLHLPSYFLIDHAFPDGKFQNTLNQIGHTSYLYFNPYLSSKLDGNLYFYIYYPYICYYFLSLSILSFIMSKWIESISINQIIQKILIYKNLHHQILILSFHITSHLLLTITHILILYR